MVMEANTQAPTQPTHIIDINLSCGIVVFYDDDDDYINARCIEIGIDIYDWTFNVEHARYIYAQAFELWGFGENYGIICEDEDVGDYYQAWHQARMENDMYPYRDDETWELINNHYHRIHTKQDQSATR
jgi:hypothetical protein